MSKEINLKSVGGYHFGAMVDLKKLEGSYFESIEADESNTIHKAIVFSISYNVDEIYNRTDGYAGNCWTATIHDSSLIDDDIYIYKFNFRNFNDLVAYYEEQEMRLVF